MVPRPLLLLMSELRDRYFLALLLYAGGGTILRGLLLSRGQGVRGVLHAPIGARLAVAAS